MHCLLVPASLRCRHGDRESAHSRLLERLSCVDLVGGDRLFGASGAGRPIPLRHLRCVAPAPNRWHSFGPDPVPRRGHRRAAALARQGQPLALLGGAGTLGREPGAERRRGRAPDLASHPAGCGDAGDRARSCARRFARKSTRGQRVDHRIPPGDQSASYECVGAEGMSALSRRGFVVGAGAAAVAVGGGVALGFRGSSSTGTLLHSQLPLPRAFATPLPIPPVLEPISSTAAGEVYEVTQKVAMADLLEGVRTEIWGYDGLLPGPTLKTHRGRKVTIHHRNELPVPAVVHLHGGKTSAEHDGYPTDLILPVGVDHHDAGPGHDGDISHGQRTYEYENDQRAST